MDILRIVNLKMLLIAVKYVCKRKHTVNACKVYHKCTDRCKCNYAVNAVNYRIWPGVCLQAEDPQPGYVSRNTAIGLCDPWTDLRMDRELLPRLETPSKKSRAKGQQNASVY